MIKKFKIELIILGILVLNVFVSYNIDIGFYNFFKNFDRSSQGEYLKKFFENITILGNSAWYFIISLMGVVLGLLIKGGKKLKQYNRFFDINIGLSIFLFSSLIVTGILTQTIKHLVGRPRPNYTSFENKIGFDFFNLNSEFHSFPSGHASTIFTVALVLALFFPKVKNFIFFSACLIGFSRVVVGAHFFTDVIGGIVIAVVGVKITRILLEKIKLLNLNKVKLKFNNSQDDNFYSIFFIFFCIMVFVSIGPSIDIYLSGLFYYGDKQFLLQSYYDITVFFRKVIIRAIVVYVLIMPIISLVFPIKLIFFNHIFTTKEIIFVWIVSLFNSLILVNLLLKNLWGRARPGDILQLGGSESFTPWYQISDSCSTNCSFVSGDAAIGFSIIILYFLTKKEIYFWLSIFLGGSLGFIRVMEGGHFFSDIIMAAVIIFIASIFQFKYYKKNYVKN